MANLSLLRENEDIQKILGKVEIETIIKKINGAKLKQVERNYLSRSIRPKLIGSAILTQQNILESIQKSHKANRNFIIFNLGKYGYDLIPPHSFNFKDKIELEYLISYIISECPEPRFIEAIPILILRNKINPYLLFEISLKKDIKNQIGYLLETSFIISDKFNFGNRIYYLKDLLKYLETHKNEERILGKEENEKYKEFLRKTRSTRMKKWNLLGRYFDKDFIKIGENYLK